MFYGWFLHISPTVNVPIAAIPMWYRTKHVGNIKIFNPFSHEKCVGGGGGVFENLGSSEYILLTNCGQNLYGYYNMILSDQSCENEKVLK